MTEAEIRRDYAPLVREHVRRADGVICVSEHTASEARLLLDVPRGEDRGHPQRRRPRLPRADHAEARWTPSWRAAGCPAAALLYVGSEEKRKNLVNLAMAYMGLARRAARACRRWSWWARDRTGPRAAPSRARRSAPPATWRRARSAPSWRRRRCSCCPRSRRASACPWPRPWRRACPSSARAAPPWRRWRATPPRS